MNSEVIERRALDRREFDLCPRWDMHEFNEVQLEDLVERAACKAVQKVKNEFYIEVGHTVVRKALWVVGFASVILFAVMVKFGWFKV